MESVKKKIMDGSYVPIVICQVTSQVWRMFRIQVWYTVYEQVDLNIVDFIKNEIS